MSALILLAFTSAAITWVAVRWAYRPDASTRSAAEAAQKATEQTLDIVRHLADALQTEEPDAPTRTHL